MEKSNTRKETTSKEKQKNNYVRKPKEEKHTNISLPLTTKITGNNNHYSLISLDINGLNSPIKRHRLSDGICE